MSNPSVADVEALASELYQTVDESRGPVTNSMDPRVIYLGSPEGLPLIRSVLSSSTSSYAIFLCSQVLRNQQLRHSSGALSHEEMVGLKDFLATVIMKRFDQGLNSYCIKNLIATLCALIKNGLADIPSFVQFPAEVCSAFSNPTTTSASSPCGLLQHPLGIAILEAMVQEVGVLNTCRPVVEHRRTTNTFRDECLTSIFNIAVENMRWIHANRGNVDPSFLSCSVALMRSVLSFDFVGLVVDEGEEEPTTLNFPSNWRETFISPGFFDMFWDLFEMCGPPVNLTIMQCLNCVCCARRSLFQTDGERSAWLERMMIGHVEIISREIWLQDAHVIGEFCRLMLRMKPNYQLKEYLERENYCRWLEAAAEFTCRVFRGWRSTFPGITHLCGMWTKLLGSQSYAPKDYPTHFERVAPMVVVAYLESRMDMAEAFAAGSSVREAPPRGPKQGIKSSSAPNQTLFGCQPSTLELIVENPLDDEGNELKQQLESVSGVLRSCLTAVVPTVANFFSTAASQFAASLQSGMVDVVAEERVAWLLYVFGSLIRSPNTGEDFECEALMISSCFELVSLVCRRSDSFPPSQPGGSAQHLVLASLHFLHCFRLIYVGDPTSQASKTLCKLQEKLELHQISCNEMQSKLLEFLMSTIVSNLRHWSCSGAVLEETLNLFKELSSGFTSARQLLEIATVKHLFSAEGATVFPFQQSAERHRHRTRYRHTITSIFFLESISSEQFAAYMNPLTNVLDTVLLSLNSGVSFLDQPQARDSILGTLCDIRGVSSACMGRRNFHILFDYLHPKLLGALRSLAELVASRNFTCDDRLETQLLRLACEISFNRCQRILFGPHNAGGFQLFHFVSDLVQLFGQKKIARIKAILLQASSGCYSTVGGQRGQLVSTVERLVAASSGTLGDSHEWLVKGSQLVLQLACCGLSGAYCNFGVLALYRDEKLNSMLSVVWQLLVMFDLDDVIVSPKLAREYFGILEQLFSIHCEFVASNPPEEIMHILRVLEASMQAVSLPSAAQNAATAAISHFANFLFERFQVKADSSLVFERCLSQYDPSYLERMLRVVFLNVVSEEGANQWSLSQPLFPLILLCPDAYLNFINNFVQTQLRSSGSIEEVSARRNRAMDLFDRLMDGVDRCNERKFRDKFQGNLTQFRSAIKQLM